MSRPQDYENDEKRSLQITDPTGNEMSINKPAKVCATCGLSCKYEKEANCVGNVKMLDDIHQHVCEFHAKKMGADNIWYESRKTGKDGPVGQMLGLGMQGDKVKESGNHAFTYKDEQDLNINYEKDDPRYTNG